MRCGYLIHNYLGRGGIKGRAPLLHRRALRAHMNPLQFARNVPIEAERYFPVEPQWLYAFPSKPALIEALTKAGLAICGPLLRIGET
jgi:hypothetical protein